MLRNISEQGHKLFGIIVKGIEEDRSAWSILKSLRERGLGYRTQVFYDDYYMIQEATKKWESMKYYPRNKVIGEGAYRPCRTPIDTKYQTKCRFYLRDPATGEEFTRSWTISHDIRMSRNELLDYWNRMRDNFTVEEEASSRKYEVLDILPLQGYRQREW